MRCASCGTENAPDSRFCGGCGAKLAPSARVAPTAKITDDAPYPSQQPGVSYQPGYSQQASGPASGPPQSSRQPMSIPPHQAIPTPLPGSLRMPTRPGSSRASTPLSEVDDSINKRTSPRAPIAVTPPHGSQSIALPAGRPVGLMVFILLVDVALAGAGAWLLAQGLAEPKAAKPEQKTQAPASAPNVEARASSIETSSGVNVAASAPRANGNGASLAATTSPARQPTTPKPSASASTAKVTPAPTPTPTTAPQPAPAPAPAPTPTAMPDDPYVEVPFDTQLDEKTAASKASFARCASDAGEPHGSVKIAFRVLEDGSVANAYPVENSTGSPNLAQCLAQTISTWRFTPHFGAAINSLRAFNYP